MTSEELKELKREAGVTWQYIADSVGVHIATVYRWAGGDVAINKRTANELRRVLKCV